MNQSNVIFFFLFAAFFVFITMRGELPKYMGFLLLPPSGGTTGATGGPQQTSNVGADNAAKVAKLAQIAEAFA